jgi:hypothetical protein
VVNQASPMPFIFTLAMEFGLRAGQSQPSHNTHAAATCPHDIPAPVVTGLPVKYASTPAPSGGTVGVGLKCLAKVPCTLTATMTLPDAKATATTPSPVSIPAGKSRVISFTFTPAQVQQEIQSENPIATIVEHNTAPVQYDFKISETLELK